MNFNSETSFLERTLVCFVLDCSCSMSNYIDDLNRTIKDLLGDIRSDPRMSVHLDIAMISFNNSIKLIQKPTLASNICFQELRSEGYSNVCDMLAAVTEAFEVASSVVRSYVKQSINYKSPWIILITNGEDAQKNDELKVIRQDINKFNEKYVRCQWLPIFLDRSVNNVSKHWWNCETLTCVIEDFDVEKQHPVILGEKSLFELLTGYSQFMRFVATACNPHLQHSEHVWGIFSSEYIQENKCSET